MSWFFELLINTHKEKPTNESVPVLKPNDPSSTSKTVKNSETLDNQLNTMQENPIVSIKKLKPL